MSNSKSSMKILIDFINICMIKNIVDDVELVCNLIYSNTNMRKFKKILFVNDFLHNVFMFLLKHNRNQCAIETANIILILRKDIFYADLLYKMTYNIKDNDSKENLTLKLSIFNIILSNFPNYTIK